MTITDTDIRELYNEARQHGDAEMMECCEDALDGDEDAREECERIIRANRAER